MANLQIHTSHKDKVIVALLNTANQNVKDEIYNALPPTLPPSVHLSSHAKMHQIIIGANSWHSGKSIHFVADGEIFCPSVPAQAVQECKITFKKGAISVRIDDRTLHKTEVLGFTQNEGYVDLKEFKEAFFKAYSDEHHKTIVHKCTLVQWTKLVY